MSRRHKHEDHVNHEAWAIPYGDLVTLLLAFFVVMYAMSSVNEGKYRVLSDSLNAAFSGSPRTMQPIQVGEKQVGSGADIQMTVVQQAMHTGQPRSMLAPPPVLWKGVTQNDPRAAHEATDSSTSDSTVKQTEKAIEELASVAREVERAMAGMIEDNLIVVRRHGLWVEVEIRTDVLFPSGVAVLSPKAVAVLQQLGTALKPFPNPIRVEGHTDNQPINTVAFPSNWELSSARAASVVHVFTKAGLEPTRLAVIGLGEFRPAQPNDTPQGRDANRRVLLIILSSDGAPEGDYAEDRGEGAPPVTVEPEITMVVPAGRPTGQLADWPLARNEDGVAVAP